MKIGSIALIFLWTLSACAPTRHHVDEIPASTTVGKGVTYYVSLPWGTTNTVALSSEHGAAVSNRVLYTELDAFLDFIDKLPPGSVLDHGVGCVVPRSYQIGDQVITVDALEKFCRQRGINLHIYGSW